MDLPGDGLSKFLHSQAFSESSASDKLENLLFPPQATNRVKAEVRRSTRMVLDNNIMMNESCFLTVNFLKRINEEIPDQSERSIQVPIF